MLNPNSIADIILCRLMTTDKGYCVSCNLVHTALLKGVEHGVSGSLISSVVTYIPSQVVADSLGTSIDNLKRLSHKMLNKNQLDILEDVSSAWYQLRSFFNFEARSLQDWICTPLPYLNGAAPAALMATVSGRRHLRNLLQIMCQGDFS